MSADLLEHNLRRLLRRSYVPALPAPPFRDRLESLFLAELARQRRPERRARRWVPLAALAAGILALLLGARTLLTPPAPTRAGLLERGAVALGLPDGSWRAADAEERAQGVVFRPPSLVVVTPAGVALDCLARDARLRLEESTELGLAAHGSAIEVTLRSGHAWLVRADGPTPLVRGEPLRLEAPAASVAVASPPAREPAAAGPEEQPGAPLAVAEHGLSGRVVAGENGRPLTRFTVGLLRERVSNQTPPPTLRTFESPDGRFEWSDPPTGRQRVFVHAEGYALWALGERELGDGPVRVEAALEEGVCVRGSVLDADGNPVPDALVLCETEAPTDGLLLADPERAFWLPVRARTGPDGRYELCHVTPGVQTLRASAEGLALAWADGVRLPAAPGEAVDFRLGPGGVVEGTVEHDDGSPWAGAEIVLVVIENGGRTRTTFDRARTDLEGRYRFECLPPVTMIVVLMRAEGPDVRPVRVVVGETAAADFGARRQGIHLSGRLLDGDEPVAGQNLGIFDRWTSSWNQDWIATTTREDGSFDFEALEAGEYLVFLIDDMGRGLRCVDGLELAGDRLEVRHEISLPRAGLAVRVRAAGDATPAAETALILMRERPDGGTDFAAMGMTDAQGSFRFDHLPEGSYRVFAYPTRAGLGYRRSELQRVGSEGESALTLELEAGGAVDVVVRTPAGDPLEGAAVVFVDATGEELIFSRAPLTDASGRFHAVGLVPGRYRARVHREGYTDTAVPFLFEPDSVREIPVLLTPLPPR